MLFHSFLQWVNIIYIARKKEIILKWILFNYIFIESLLVFFVVKSLFFFFHLLKGNYHTLIEKLLIKKNCSVKSLFVI